MTTVVELVVAAEPSAWRAVGFDIDDHDTVQVGATRVRMIGAEHGTGMTEWVLAGAPDPTVADIDGLATSHRDLPRSASPQGPPPHQPNGVIDIDHVVISTPDLDRTCGAIARSTGEPLKRIRETGAMRQGFHRLGPLVIEVVTFPEIAVGRASFWGLAFNVVDIDEIFLHCGPELMSAPKQAVQTGRRIASFRTDAALGLPVAVMTADLRRRPPD